MGAQRGERAVLRRGVMMMRVQRQSAPVASA